MGTGDIQLGGNPETDLHPVQRGEAILLNMHHAEETGISCGRLDLWLVGALLNLTLPLVALSGRCMIKLRDIKSGYNVRYSKDSFIGCFNLHSSFYF